MTESKTKKNGLIWLGVTLLLVGFAEFVILYLINDKEALTSSIYTYYQKDYYSHLSHGQLPWINFQFEYPPLAAYILLFPAFAPGLSVLTVSILRGGSTLVLSLLSLRVLSRCDRITANVQGMAAMSIGIMSCIVPGFYFGLFDWALVLCNVIMAILLFGKSDEGLASKNFWPLVFAGAATKLMPLLAAPFLIQVKQLREKSNFWLSAAITALFHLPFVLFGFHNFRVFLAYHRMRSIDCFSSYACILNALERLGKVTIVRKWAFGAIEVQGSISSILAKSSLPLFALFTLALLVATRNLIQRGHGAKSAFGMYLVAFLAYPAISKVSQHNYCVWTAATFICFWLIGYQRQAFIRSTFAGLVAMLLIGWYQDQNMVDFTLPMVPWSMIIISALRQLLTFGFVIYCIREIFRDVESNLIPASL